MPTATIEKMTPVNETAAMRKALAALAPIKAKDEELDQRVRHYTAVLDSFSALHEQQIISDIDRLEAEAHLPAARVDSAKVKLERHRAEAEVEHVRALERQKFRAVCLAEDRKDIADLEAGLRALMKVNDRLKQRQQHRHEVLGEYVERVHWWELGVEDGSRFSIWLQTLKANGLRD